MIQHLKDEWFFFRLRDGLLLDQATIVASYLPLLFVALGLLLGFVWLRRQGEQDMYGRDWIGTIAGGGAVFAIVLMGDAMMLKPVITWLLLVPDQDFLWTLRKYPEDCLRLAVGFPLFHAFVLWAYRVELGEIGSWLTLSRS